jgi:hypothetical protein
MARECRAIYGAGVHRRARQDEAQSGGKRRQMGDYQREVALCLLPADGRAICWHSTEGVASTQAISGANSTSSEGAAAQTPPNKSWRLVIHASTSFSRGRRHRTAARMLRFNRWSGRHVSEPTLFSRSELRWPLAMMLDTVLAGSLVAADRDPGLSANPGPPITGAPAAATSAARSRGRARGPAARR